MATASAKKKTVAIAPRMTIEPAEGGVTTQVHEPFGMSNGTNPMGAQPPLPVVHTDLESLHAHVKKHFGHLFGKKAAGAGTKSVGVADTDNDGA